MSDNSSVPSRAVSPVNDPLETAQTARPFRFTWDLATRKSGPGSVSEATEGRGDYLATARLRPDVLNTAPANLPTGSLPLEWSSSRHGFHAISTMLNNPHKRQAPPKAHSSLPAVPPTELPRVRRKDFDSYLRAISAEWDRFEKNRQFGQQGVAQLDGQSTPRASLSTEQPTSPRKLRGGSGKTMPALETVPPIFFETSFNLGDPRTFRIVTEQGDEEDEASDSSSLSHSLPIMEKLSHYADTVEQHLVREISLRSTSFFAALTNLHDLQSESEQCLDRITKLRVLLKDVDEKGAKRGLGIIRKESKLRNLNIVRDSVKMVAGVMEMTGVAKGLVSAGQWGEALGVIEEIEDLCNADEKLTQNELAQASPITPVRKGPLSPLPPLPEAEENQTKPRKPPLPVPLSSLRAFASLPSHLRTLTMEIASSLSLEMVNVLRIDLLEKMNGDDLSLSSQHPDVNQPLKDRLRPLLHGLVRAKGLREATLSWREVVMGEVQNITKRHLPSSESVDESSRSNLNSTPDPSAVNHLRNLPHAEFISLLQPVYKVYLNGIIGLQNQNSMVMDILQAIPKSSTLDLLVLQDELHNILSSAAELSNTRAAKLLSARTEQNAGLELPEFLAFFNESWNFVVKCEVICRHMIVGLRGVVISQAKAFLQVFHQTRISRSAKLVEDEQWSPCEVTLTLQHLADVLVDAAVRDPEELIIAIPGGPAENSASSPPTTAVPNGAPPSSPSGTPTIQNGSRAPSTSSRYLSIESKTYYVVSATSESLMFLLDYLRVIVNLSTLTMDTMSRVIEFLKAFNSRTCQVVLGAGAMRSAGLKNITAKHLALASQSLSIMIALIPYVRETFRRHLSATQAVILVEFDKLKRDYQEHQNEIHAKLIAIMGDRLSAHIKTLHAINWDVPKQGINDYMELLVKETVTLHKVLSRYLTTAILEDVMTQVFAAINHRLSEEYGKIELPTPEAKARLLADAKYLHQRLSALKNVSGLSGMLETVVTEKSIARKEPAAQPIAEAVKGGANAVQRSKGFLPFKSPVTEKALPTPTTESVATPINGIGRKSDINGRVNARLSSLMSPPASSVAAVPGESEKNELKDRNGKLKEEDVPGASLETPRTDPSGDAGTSVTAADAGSGPLLDEASAQPAGSPHQEGEAAPVPGKEARPFSPSASIGVDQPT